MTQIFTADRTTTIYQTTDNSRWPLARLQAGETAEIVKILVDGIWIEAKAKGVQGYIERRFGGISEVKPPVPTGELLWIKGYFDVYGIDYVTRKGIEEGTTEQLADVYGLPAAIKLYTTKRIDISKETATRKLWFEEFAKRAPTGITNINSRFAGLLSNGRCYTDSAGGTGFNQVITACNIVYSMGNPENKQGGGLMRPIRMLKVGSYVSMRDQLYKYPYLLHNATISTRGPVNSPIAADNGTGKEVIPFWNLAGRDVKIPNFCIDEVNWIPEAFIEPYTGQTSYYPPR